MPLEELIKHCGKEGCNPVEQTRCEMKPEDHHLQWNRLKAMEEFAKDFPNHGISIDLSTYRKDVYEIELEDEHRYDFRISCSKCGKATGWGRRDTENYVRKADAQNIRHVVTRDGNMEYIRALWNQMVK